MSIRKAFWCCAALAVAGAAGSYLAADHATRHQDSFLGRVFGTYHAAIHSTPALAAGRAACARGCEDAPRMGGRVTGLPAEETSEACEEIDRSRYRLPGRIVVKEEEAEAYRDVLITAAESRGGFHAEAEKWVAEGAAVELIPPPTLIEGDSFALQLGVFQLPDAVEPAVMPPAADDPTPAVMPYAADDFVSFWKRLLGKSGGCCCKDEEGEAPLPGQPPECHEDPYLPLLYPGCPQPICPHQRFYCPYSGRMMTPDDPAEAKAPAPVKPARPRALEGVEESEVRRKYVSVDTMEFRPSDAKPEEFGLVPF